jgi:transcriptional regulator with XRE-family HTH domain
MLIGERLKALREQKNMTQGDIQKRTGMLRAYISRVENGHTGPSIETLEKFSHALEVPLYAIFYDGEKPPKANVSTPGGAMDWGRSGHDAKTLNRFRRLMGRMEQGDLNLLLFVAQRLAQKKKRGT